MNMLEKSIVPILKMFEEYAITNSDKQLSNAELSALIMCQLRSPEFQSKVNQEDICEAMQKIDENNEGQMNIKEFSQSVEILARGYGKYGKYGKSKDKVHD